MGKAFLGPLSQLQVTDFEEIRSYRAPPGAVVQVTDALCDLFHRETGWASAKQLLGTQDFYQVGFSGGASGALTGSLRVGGRLEPLWLPRPSYHTLSQELVFFPKEKMTDSEMVKLSRALKAPGMSDAALGAVSVPAARLAAWLWAVLCYGLAQRRGLATGLLLRQVEATLAREQARLGHYQFQAQEMLEHSLALTKKLEEAQAAYRHVGEMLSRTQSGRGCKWSIKAALFTPMHSWTTELQVTSPPGLPPPVQFAPLPPWPPHSLPPLPGSTPCLAPSPWPLGLYPPPAYPPPGLPSTPEAEETPHNRAWRCPPVFCCHQLPGSLPSGAATGAAGQVAGSLQGLSGAPGP